jgi:hypothetical protein
MKRGSDTWVTLSQDVMPSKLEALEDFKYFDEKGHDQVSHPTPFKHLKHRQGSRC